MSKQGSSVQGCHIDNNCLLEFFYWVTTFWSVHNMGIHGSNTEYPSYYGNKSQEVVLN